MGEAPGDGQGFVETAHLALTCSRPGRLSSLEPFAAGREQAIRDAALGALRRSRPYAKLSARRRPARSGDQRMAALERARQDPRPAHAAEAAASLRARADRQILLYSRDYVETAEVADILLAMPSFGRVKVHRLLMQCGISPRKTFKGLSPPQRDELIKLL